ncbi:hypothetical protein SGRIM128S_08676 [Streptomyces griseomycini]
MPEVCRTPSNVTDTWSAVTVWVPRGVCSTGSVTRRWNAAGLGVPPMRQPSGTEKGSVQPSPRGRSSSRRTAAAASYTSSGTSAGTRPSASRSTRPVSMSPETTAGCASSRRRNPALVCTPSVTVRARAARSLRSAVARSGPYAITLDSIGS